MIEAIVQGRGHPLAKVTGYANGEQLGTLEGPPFRWVHEPSSRDAPILIRVVARDAGGLEAADEVLVASGNTSLFASDSRAVTMTLLVTDRRGRFVTDMRPQEITVLDDDRPQKILDFTRTEAPLRAVLLLDRSGSMEGKMQEARRAVAALLGQLEPEDRVKLLGFNHRTQQLTSFTADRELVVDATTAVTPDGGTALYDAILVALEELRTLAQTRVRPAILVFSDGRDQHSVNQLGAVVRAVRNAGITIFAIGQGDALDDDNLRDGLETMAVETGGKALFERRASRLPGMFSEIGRQLRAMYFLSFSPDNPEPGWHELEVSSSRDRTRVRHRRGYERE